MERGKVTQRGWQAGRGLMVGKKSSRVVDGEGRRGKKKRVVGGKREGVVKKSSRAECGKGRRAQRGL